MEDLATTMGGDSMLTTDNFMAEWLRQPSVKDFKAFKARETYEPADLQQQGIYNNEIREFCFIGLHYYDMKRD